MKPALQRLAMFVLLSLVEQNEIPCGPVERLAIEQALRERIDALIASADAGATWEDLQDPAIDAAIEIGALVLGLEIVGPTQMQH